MLTCQEAGWFLGVGVGDPAASLQSKESLSTCCGIVCLTPAQARFSSSLRFAAFFIFFFYSLTRAGTVQYSAVQCRIWA